MEIVVWTIVLIGEAEFLGCSVLPAADFTSMDSYQMSVEKDIRDALRTLKLFKAEVQPRPRRERRRISRERQLPEDRVCPVCKTVVLASRRWVVLPDGPKCKSCHMRRRTR